MKKYLTQRIIAAFGILSILSSCTINSPVSYKKLTEQEIDSTPDSLLLQLVFDNLLERIPKDFSKEFETVQTWNNAQQAIYIIWSFEAEVNNGGFNQFYFNSSGQYYKLLPSALQLVGAKKFVDLSQRANDVFEKENAKITEHQDGTLDGFSESYKNNPLNKFDDEFYALDEMENLEQLQVAFIRKNKLEFIK